MSQVDSVHAAARTVSSGETEPIRADEPFDAVLALIRRSSAVSNDDFQRARRLGAAHERHQRAVDPASDQTRTEKLHDRHRQETVTQDTHADHLREQVNEAQRADEMQTSPTEARQQTLRETHTNEPVRRQETTALPNRAGTDQADETTTAKAGSASSGTGWDQPTGDDQKQGRASDNAFAGAKGSSQANESGAADSGRARQNVVTRRDAQAILSRTASPSGGPKPAASTGRPAGAAEFQNLMAAAARQRGPAKAVLESTLTAKSSGHPIINPKDAASFNELARIVRSNIGQRHSSLVLRLDPPELGNIRIDMRMHDQTLTLRIEAQTPAGQEALQGRLADLRSALEQHGIQLRQVDVELRDPAPTDETRDAHNRNSESSPWDEGETNGSWDQPAPHDGRHAADHPPPSLPSESATIEATDVGETEHDNVRHSAETGVDVIV